MTALHLVFSRRGLASCEPRRLPGDRVVLLADGVYAAMSAGDIERASLLADDLRARGAVNRLGLDEITHEKLVALCVDHAPIVSWND